MCKDFSERHNYLTVSYMSPHTITFPLVGMEMLLKSNCDIAELHHNETAVTAAVKTA